MPVKPSTLPVTGSPGYACTDRPKYRGGGDGGGGTLSLVESALVFFDSVDRDDSATVGGPDVGTGAWVEEQNPNSQSVLNNRYRLVSGAGTNIVGHRPNAEATGPALFFQGRVRWSGSTASVFLRLDAGAFSSEDGYALALNSNSNEVQLYRVTNGSATLIDSAAMTDTPGSDYIYELWIDEAEQEGVVFLASTPESPVSVSAADSNHDEVDKRVRAQLTAASSETGDVDDIWSATSKQIVCTGLTVGQKIQVRKVSDDTLIAEATAISGTATIDISVFVGTGLESPDRWPAGAGTALKMELRESDDTLVDTLLGSSLAHGNIWPGEYTA